MIESGYPNARTAEFQLIEVRGRGYYRTLRENSAGAGDLS